VPVVENVSTDGGPCGTFQNGLVRLSCPKGQTCQGLIPGVSQIDPIPGECGPANLGVQASVGTQGGVGESYDTALLYIWDANVMIGVRQNLPGRAL
jgi:hypothetical protein